MKRTSPDASEYMMLPERRSKWQKRCSYNNSLALLAGPAKFSKSWAPWPFLGDGKRSSSASSSTSKRGKGSASFNFSALAGSSGKDTSFPSLIHSRSCAQTSVPALAVQRSWTSARRAALRDWKSTGCVCSISKASKGLLPSSHPSSRPFPNSPCSFGPKPASLSTAKVAFSCCRSHTTSPAFPKTRANTRTAPVLEPSFGPTR
mmetsp:Transcript_66096/g.166673  ORF Transcript_66096/g.166673 Transcript_66096/m.166673 type:complete len:204 (-) Transcript_66096:269-880(-)